MKFSPLRRLSAVLAAAICAWGAEANGQTAMTSIGTTLISGTPTTVNGVVFNNDILRLDYFTTATTTYVTDSIAQAVYIRRNTDSNGNGTPNQAGSDNLNGSSVAYISVAGDTTTMRGAYATTYESAFLANNLLRTTDNVFGNLPTQTATLPNQNIERVDFILNPAGVVATADMAFAILERGIATNHDPIKIAVITGFNASTGAVTDYSGNLVSVTASSYGSSNFPVNDGSTSPASTFNFTIYEYNSTSDLSGAWSSAGDVTNQGLGGVVITLANLGIAAGTTIYGYSIMGADVTTGGNIDNLINWNNTTRFPTNTDESTGFAGGADLITVGGVLFKSAAPEPATYGMLFLGAAVGLVGLKRARARQSHVAA